ncbi:MAG: tetratricopeptide repeat-containing sulfotransferase family protein [Parvularculaceae bacterium]
MAVDDLINEAIALAGATEVGRARVTAERALSEAPDSAAAHNAMGIIETADHQHAEAARWYETASALDPANASYIINVGYSKVLMGEFETARELFERALEIDPANSSAFQNIVWITKARPGDPLIDRLRDLAGNALRGSDDYVKLNYALGKCLDDAGDYDAAFEAYARANNAHPSRYDRAEHEEFFADIASVWTRARIETVKPLGSDSDKPVFIIGMPRSGSTLVEEKLCADPRVAGLGEVPDIIRMSGVMTRSHPQQLYYPAWCAVCPDHAFGGLGRLYLEKYEARRPHAQRLINKSLLNFAYAGMIASMFPRALIIETRRDPIDTCLSCYFKDLKTAHQYSTRLASLGHLYRLYDANIRLWRERLDNLVTVQYETFIADVDGGTVALKAAMGLEGAATGETQARHVQTFSAWQVRQPVYTHAIKRWKNYEKHLGPLIDSLGDLAGH